MSSDTPLPKSISPGSSPLILDKCRPKSSSSAPSPQHRSPTPFDHANLEQKCQYNTQSSSLHSNVNPQSQQFCLRWNNYQNNLTSVFDQLLQNESFVDVTLACDGQSIKAHKVVLSACSPYFQELLYDNPCQHPIIIMRDVKWADLKAAVEFMYKGEINVSQDQIGPLLKVAEMLKIRGLAEVNGETDSGPHTTTSATATPRTTTTIESEVAVKRSRIEHELESSSVESNLNTLRNRKRRWVSTDNSGIISPLIPGVLHTSGNNSNFSGSGNTGGNSINSEGHEISATGSGGCGSATNARTPTPEHNEIPSPVAGANASQMSTPNSKNLPPFQMPVPLDTMGLSSLGISHADDLEIKPGIAEMIREEERAKLIENSHWIGPSTSSIADSYQYQLQSMWQKCWSTNQNLMHHLRFRERGPLKSWRPETMAEAIFSVLKEGLSLSQAARKYDIPYPTFVLYANRVHNMLGPSIDGGTDLRPKGRGRPQRILLGIWPDDHMREVIRTVVFRDVKELKEEAMHLSYGRHSPVFPFQDGPLSFPGSSCSNGLPPQQTGSAGESMSPGATAAAVAAVAHGLRQQMQMAAAAHHSENTSNLFNLPTHLHANNMNIPLPKQNSPTSSNNGSSGLFNTQRNSSPALPNPSTPGLSGISNMHGISNNNNQQTLVSSSSTIASSPHSSSNVNQQHKLSSSLSPITASPNQSSHSQINNLTITNVLSNRTRNDPPIESAHDLRLANIEDNSLSLPLESPSLEPAVNLAIGISGMSCKPSQGYSSPRPENLFQEDISELVGNSQKNCPSNLSNFKEPTSTIKIEPIADCRNE